MDSFLEVCKGPYVVWTTEKAVKDRERKSSVFSLLGATWQLEMKRPASVTTLWEIYLRRTGNIKPRTQFSVITSVQSSKSMKDSDAQRYRSVGCCNTNVIGDFTELWWQNKSECSKNITGFDGDPYVTVICLFTAMSGIENETVEVTTQTELDRLLPEKNLLDVKQSSDDNLVSLSEDLRKLLDDKVLPDIHLRCGDRTVPVHKAILTARSQVFSAMFQSKMSESETGVVDITDVDVDVLEMFLKYVYSGRLSDVTDEGLPSLYVVGDKYDVKALKKECSERMTNNLSRENCLNILLLANAHSDQDLKNVILDFILNQMEFLKSEEWAKFRKENPSLSCDVYDFVAQRKWL